LSAPAAIAGAGGAGIAAVPDDFAGPDVRKGLLQRVLPQWRPPAATAWAVFPGRKLMPTKTRAFIDMLRIALGADTGEAQRP
jgi:DNA-binding transcriptional LysR family regulator